ncbi:MAG: hypothetical protein WBF05_04255, partial [Anaerolineales bacterium]
RKGIRHAAFKERMLGILRMLGESEAFAPRNETLASKEQMLYGSLVSAAWEPPINMKPKPNTRFDQPEADQSTVST